MKKIPSMLFGPECFWLVIYMAMHLVALSNVPPTESGSESLEEWWFLLPFLAMPLSFTAFASRPARPWLLLVRINALGLTGLCCAAYRVTSAVDYGDSRNSGVPMGWVMSVSVGILVLFAADCVALIVIAIASRRKKASNADVSSLG